MCVYLCAHLCQKAKNRVEEKRGVQWELPHNRAFLFAKACVQEIHSTSRLA